MSGSANATRIIQGSENVTGATLKFLSNAKSRIDICTGVLTAKTSDPIATFAPPLLEAGKRGVRLRVIGSFEKEDLPILEGFSGAVQLRHLDGVSSYCGVSEVECLAIPDTSGF